jgi:hypothetical protein
MAFVKFSVPAPEKPQVRFSKLGISLTQAALDSHGLGDATAVYLYYDQETDAVGISPADANDKASFPLTRRGRSQSQRFVAWGKFAQQFGLDTENLTTSDGKLHRIGELVAFGLAASKGPKRTRVGRQSAEAINGSLDTAETVVKKPYTGKPRGRKKKVVESTETV